MSRAPFVAAYLAGTVATIVLLDANIGMGELALVIWAAVSILLGLGTGQPAFALMAFAAVLVAVPFGYPNDYEFSEPLPIWWGVAVCSFFSAGLIFITAFIRRIVVLRRQRVTL